MTRQIPIEWIRPVRWRQHKHARGAGTEDDIDERRPLHADHALGRAEQGGLFAQAMPLRPHHFEAEALALGHRVDAGVVMAGLVGEVRPAMVEAVSRCAERFKTACLTNNFMLDRTVDLATDRPDIAEIYALFDLVIESSKVGVRKPDPRFYEMACEALSVAPHEVVYLDDLGINLKPARAMGMHTIKVTAPDVALEELSSVLGIPLA